MLTTRSPHTLSVAKGTPVRLHLRAMKGFKGTYAMVGAPADAKLNAKSGDFDWTARAGRFELGFAAIDGSECATGAIVVDVVENDKTRINLARWNFYVPLRDAELEAFGTDEEISHSYWDGETEEMAEARRAREKKEAAAERQKYLDSLACGHVPGESLDERDVDGDGQLDLVDMLRKGNSFVLLKKPTGYVVFGKVIGSAEQNTVDHHTLFVDSDSAENSTWTHVSWIHGGALRKLDLDGTNGDFRVEWHDALGGVDGVAVTRSGVKSEYLWRDGDFVAKK